MKEGPDLMPPYKFCCPPTLCCCPCCPQRKSAFTAVKRGRPDGQPLSGAEYGLFREGRLVSTVFSDSAGRLAFTGLSQGFYELRELHAPAGYQPEAGGHTVAVEADGRVTIDGLPADGFSLYNERLAGLVFRKMDAMTGFPLGGAVFTLSTGAVAVSGTDGTVGFGPLPAGSYTLRETVPPAGYLPNPHVYAVTVSTGGAVTVDGVDVSVFSVGNSRTADFSFRKYDAVTGLPLPAAGFWLSNGESAVSNMEGFVKFGQLSPGSYIMLENQTPPGYLANTHIYSVDVSADGEVTVDGVPLAAFSVPNTPYPNLAFYKREAGSGAPLAGAGFSLDPGGVAVSNGNGLVDLGPLTPGAYTLEETHPPVGYLPDPQSYRVEVSAAGEITVNGLPLSAFSVFNTPSPVLSFRKYGTGGTPLSGAEFRLSTGAAAVSDSGGLVNLGRLAPGDYQLAETAAPSGYELEGVTHLVHVSAAGEILVDNMPLSDFSVTNRPARSEMPTINWILEHDFIVSGQGVPGASVTVTFPNGSTATAVVSADGSWLVTVPGILVAGEYVSAVQTEVGKTESDPAYMEVRRAS